MTATQDFAEDVAVISGATGGIGGAIAGTLARRGATVVLLGRDRGRLEAARERIGATIDQPAELAEVVLDVNSADSVERGVAAVLDRFGRIDVLVNSAGDGPVAPLLDTTEELWHTTINGKLLGAVRLTRAVGRSMVERGAGRIAFIGGSFRREPDPLFVINGVANAGLGALAKAISRELGSSGLRINVVDPGATDTPLWLRTLEELADRFGTTAELVGKDFIAKAPYGSLPTPRDVAEVVAFVVSRANAQVNGTSITVDGGASVAL